MNVCDVSYGLNDAKRDYNQLTACLQDRSPRCYWLTLICGNLSYGEPVVYGRVISAGGERLLLLLLLSAQEMFILTTRMRIPNAL